MKPGRKKGTRIKKRFSCPDCGKLYAYEACLFKHFKRTGHDNCYHDKLEKYEVVI